jgi:signal transduction histidine kinase
MRSLQARLGAGLFISLVLVFFLLWLVVSNSIRYLAENYIASRLEHDSEILLGATNFDSQGLPTLNKNRLGQIYQRPFSGHYFIITSGTHKIRSRSLWDKSLDTRAVVTGEIKRLYSTGPQDQPLLVLITGYRKLDKTVTIAVAEDLSHIESELTVFQWRFTFSAIVALFFLMVLHVIMIRKGLRPLNNIQEELRALERGELQSLNNQVPMEISPLIDEINHLVMASNQRLQRSRNALADLAHALKKPLTVLNQLSNDPAVKKLPDIQNTLDTQTAAMRQSMDRVLKRARLAGEGFAGARFSANSEVIQLLKVLDAMYREKNLQFETDIPDALILPYDREDVLELLGNIIENACKWATQKINIRINLDNDKNTRIIIEDDGAGVPEKNLDTLVQRGIRLDENTEGHGIGLSIARDIVDQYKGTMKFGQSEQLGGFRVEIKLPALATR